MKRSPFPWLAVLAVLSAIAALTSGCGGESPPEVPEPRRVAGRAAGWNVLLVTLDTVRADRLGAYGYDERDASPALDGLLSSGVRFARATAPRALTWPSLASVLTGLYPSGHGVLENGYELPAELPTLPLVLGGSGYRTAAFLSNMCRANHQGWDTFACSGGEDGKTIRRAVDWVRSADAGEDRPFLLWVHLFAAHGPYYNGGDLAATALDPGYDGPLGPKKWRLDRVMTEELPLSERDLTHLDALYDAAVMGTDRLVKRLLAGLEAAGALEETVIVLLSDHGEELYQHNRYLYHACSVYETTLHVPFGIVAPGLLPAGGVVEPAVELTDVAPTLFDLLGVAPPEDLHGVSLAPYLARPDARGGGKPAFSEYGAEPIHTVLSGRYKLVDNPEDIHPYCFPGAPPDHYPLAEVELYDLQEDPGETTNLAADHPARVAELRAMIRERFAGLSRRNQPQEVDPELKKELEALGYVAR